MERKVYEKRSDKVIDFLIGFLLIPAFVGITIWFISILPGFRYFRGVISLVVFIAEIVAAIYLCRRRKYMGIGLLYALVVVPLVLAGTCFLIFFGGNMFSMFRR